VPRILRRLPYIHETNRPQLLAGRARRRQIMLHVGIAPLAQPSESAEVPPPTIRAIPLVLDTGFTHSLLLRQSHLRHLTLTPTVSYRDSDFRLTGRNVDLIRRRTPAAAVAGSEQVSVPTRYARLWFYPNITGSWEIDSKAEPTFMRSSSELIIAPSDDLTPSGMASPLFGLGGINDCDLFTLAYAGHLDLWTGRPWWWRFLRPFIR